MSVAPATATQLYENGRILTMSRAAGASEAEAMAARDGVIVAVGTARDVAAVAGADAERCDLRGQTLLPGFIDAHHHPSIVALYGALVRLVRPHVTDVASLQRALAAAAEKLAPGEWLVACDWDELNFKERRPPTRAELDEAVPDRPLFAMHYSCHRAVVNSRALELAGIDRNTASPSGGTISRGKDRVPDGLLIERAMCRAEEAARASLIAQDADGYFARLTRHHEALLAKGVTYVVDATVPTDLLTLYREGLRRGALRVPTLAFPVSTKGYLEAPWDILDGPVTGQADDELLRVGPVKLVFDGAPGCAMCLSWWQVAGSTLSAWARAAEDGSLDAVRTALSVKPRFEGTSVRTGIAIYRHDEAEAIVRAAAQRGFSVAIHAVGNEAVETALDAYAAAPVNGAAALRRIEHATFLDEPLVRRIKDSGVAVVAQPHFMSLPTYASAPSIPGLRNSPLRWLLDAGVPVAGSSDFPVAGFDPLDGVRSAMSRKTLRGHVYEGDQCVSLDEALAMYTRTAAEVCGEGATRGTLEVGKRADFVVVRGSLRRAEELETARVVATALGGEVVFGSLAS